MRHGSAPVARLSVSILAIAGALSCGARVNLGGSDDGGERDAGSSCPAFASPTTDAPCKGCDKADDDCQPNGCYNSYLCDVSERDCKSPGTPCAEPDAR